MHKFKRDLEAKRLEKGKIYAFCEKLKTNYEIFAFIDNFIKIFCTININIWKLF